MMASNAEVSRFRQVWRHVKDHTAQYFATTVMVGAAVAVLSVRGCGDHATPMHEDIVRGDGVCHQLESYPYDRNNDGSIKTTNGSRVERPQDCATQQGNICVPNPRYSKEDCHDGDGVCDNSPDRAQLRDPAGNPVANLLSRDVYNREITLPLEGPASYDCLMQPARDQPCGAVDPSHPVLTRPRIAQPVAGLRQRTQEEWMSFIASHPPIVQSQQPQPPAPAASGSAAQVPSAQAPLPAAGSPSLRLTTAGNYFTVLAQYQETCNTSLQICTPLSTEACFCPNVRECAEIQPVPVRVTCGNGRLDSGEQCDFRSRAPRGGCSDTHTACSRQCRCIQVDPRQPQPVCGNGVVETGEECDRNTGCASGETCNSNCQCESSPGPVNQSTRCPSDVMQRLAQRAYSNAQGNPGAVRDAAGASSSNPVTINVSVHIEAGVANATAAAGTCVGCNPPSGRRPISPTIFNLSAVPTGYQGTCDGEIPTFTLQPG